MPNLEQIISFREEYGIGRQKITDSFDSKLLKQYIQAERLRELRALENNGRLDERFVTFSADINNKPEIVKYYERQAKAWVSLLFFDITDFVFLTTRKVFRLPLLLKSYLRPPPNTTPTEILKCRLAFSSNL